jgi:uncharacterized metal-binding protein YceD (DUF177 family)
MPLIFNLRHLQKRDLRLEGELSADELELDGIDELIKVAESICYDVTVERLSDSLLVRGRLRSALACQCVRCLGSYTQRLDVADWTCDLPLSGEGKVLINNDYVDLTPYLREDILLAFPQQPLCDPECRGLLEAVRDLHKPAGVEEQISGTCSAWSELNKLKF